jgi:hypothetical protein
MGQNYLMGVWRPGEGPQAWAYGKSGDAFTAEDKVQAAKGMVLADLRVRDDHYTAVWRPGKAKQEWVFGLSEPLFQAMDIAFLNAGMRLCSLSVHGGNFTAVWRAGDGEERWECGMSVDEFGKRTAHWFEHGLRIQSVSYHDDKIACVWRPGSGAQKWLAHTSLDKLVDYDSGMFKKGMRMRRLAVDDGGEFNGGGKWLAVWTEDDGPRYWRTAPTSDFADAESDMFGKGYRLTALGHWQGGITPIHIKPWWGNGSTTPPQPSAVTKMMILDENESATSGDQWMYYSRSIPSSDPLSAKHVTSVENNTKYRYILSHNGVSTGELKPGAKADFSGAGTYAGLWSAEILDVKLPSFAPPSLSVNITMQ